MAGIAALILAAGLGQRFGGAKLDAEIGGQTVLGHVLACTDRPAIARRFVVARAGLKALENAPVRIVTPSPAPVSMSASIVAGVRAVTATADFDGLFLILGDMPCIPGALIDAMAVSLAGPDQVVVPIHRGRRGHPVLFGRSSFADLMQLSGDGGARDVIDRARRIVEIPCEDDGIFLDIDRPADLAAAARHLARNPVQAISSGTR